MNGLYRNHSSTGSSSMPITTMPDMSSMPRIPLSSAALSNYNHTNHNGIGHVQFTSNNSVANQQNQTHSMRHSATFPMQYNPPNPQTTRQTLGLLQISHLSKSLISETVTNNPDMDLFGLIHKKYGNVNVAMIEVEIKQYVSLNGNLKPIRFPAQIIQNIRNQNNELEGIPPIIDNECNILNHVQKGRVPKSIQKEKSNLLPTDTANTKTKKEPTGNCIKDSGLSDKEFCDIYRCIIRNQTVNKRKVSGASDATQKAVEKVLNVLVCNEIVSKGKNGGYLCITGQIDKVTKLYKKIKYNQNINKEIWDKYNEYTAAYNADKNKKDNTQQNTEHKANGTASNGTNQPKQPQNKRGSSELDKSCAASQPPTKKQRLNDVSHQNDA